VEPDSLAAASKSDHRKGQGLALNQRQEGGRQMSKKKNLGSGKDAGRRIQSPSFFEFEEGATISHKQKSK